MWARRAAWWAQRSSASADPITSESKLFHMMPGKALYGHNAHKAGKCKLTAMMPEQSTKITMLASHIPVALFELICIWEPEFAKQHKVTCENRGRKESREADHVHV